MIKPTMPLYMLGAGGHAKVLLALIEALGSSIKGVFDPVLFRQGISHWHGLSVLGDDEVLKGMQGERKALINGIGQTVADQTRRGVYKKMLDSGFVFPPLVHPASWVAKDASLSDGVQVMAGAVIQPDCQIGENSIVNTCASIDHDSRIGAHVHIAPGATLCGGVRVGDGAFVAAGATIIQDIQVGEGAVVGAGVTLVRDLPGGQIVLGAKARFG